jgi:hypothetical protein
LVLAGEGCTSAVFVLWHLWFNLRFFPALGLVIARAAGNLQRPLPLEFKLQLVPYTDPVRENGSAFSLETLPFKTFFW